MKKIFKILILVIGLIPLLVNAEEKEVQYKWYKEVEENIRYENNAENICEYFDKNTFITTDWYYSTSKPKEEKFRTAIAHKYKSSKQYRKKIKKSFGDILNFISSPP